MWRLCYASHAIPPLTAVNCGTLTNPTNGQVSYTAGTIIRQTATYSCNRGYNLVGNRTHTCQATGLWSESAPTCLGMLLLHPTCMCTQCRQAFGPIHMLYNYRGFHSLHTVYIQEAHHITTSSQYTVHVHIIVVGSKLEV